MGTRMASSTRTNSWLTTWASARRYKSPTKRKTTLKRPRKRRRERRPKPSLQKLKRRRKPRLLLLPKKRKLLLPKKHPLLKRSPQKRLLLLNEITHKSVIICHRMTQQFDILTLHKYSSEK